jgi:hypothetical protein
MTTLQRLQGAVEAHIENMEGLMKGPSSYERGQAIARSICALESALKASRRPAKETDGAKVEGYSGNTLCARCNLKLCYHEATSLRCPVGAAFHKRNRFAPKLSPGCGTSVCTATTATRYDAHAH